MPECMSCVGAGPVSERGSMDGRFSPEMSQVGDGLPGEHRSNGDEQPDSLDDEHEDDDDDGSVRSAQAARDARTVMTLHSIDEARAFEFDDMDEPTGQDESSERSSFSRIAMEHDVGASDLGGHAFSVANAHARMTEPDMGAADVGPDHQDVPGSPLAGQGSRSSARPPIVPTASTPTSPHSRTRGFRMRGMPKVTLSSSASVVSDGRTVTSTMAQRPFSPELPSHKRDDTFAPGMVGASSSSRADSPGITPSELHEPGPGGMASLTHTDEHDSDDDCSCASDAGVTVNTARAARPRQSQSRSSSRSSGASSIGPQSLGETPLEALLVSHPGEHGEHAPGRNGRALSGGPAGNANDSVVAVQGMPSGRAGTSVYSRGSGLGAVARATTAGRTSVSGISQVTSRASCTSLQSESSHSEYSAEQEHWRSTASHPEPSADQSSVRAQLGGRRSTPAAPGGTA